MSFSSEVKNEVCKVPSVKKCCALAEAYGVLLYCNTFTGREIKIITESRAFAERLIKLFKKAFGIEFDEVPADFSAVKLIFVIRDTDKIEGIFDSYGYSRENSIALHINLAMLENECCRMAFIKGAFLAGGSVTDPVKRYHLELVTSHMSVSRETYSLLLELGLAPKQTTRAGNYITYFKQSEYIEDCLTMIGAPVSSMAIMEAKMEKELRNSVNRRVNCDTANLGKAVDAAQQQLEAFKVIEAGPGLLSLPDKLQMTARVRMENPEATLSELAEMMDPPITKSCLNHRFRKIAEIAKSIAL